MFFCVSVRPLVYTDGTFRHEFMRANSEGYLPSTQQGVKGKFDFLTCDLRLVVDAQTWALTLPMKRESGPNRQCVCRKAPPIVPLFGILFCLKWKFFSSVKKEFMGPSKQRPTVP